MTAFFDTHGEHADNRRRTKAPALRGSFLIASVAPMVQRTALLIAAAARAAVREWQVWQTVRALRTLSDSTLADIGIPRSAIPYAARNSIHPQARS